MTRFLALSLACAALVASARGALNMSAPLQPHNVAADWAANNLQAISNTSMTPPVIARCLFMVNSAMLLAALPFSNDTAANITMNGVEVTPRPNSSESDLNIAISHAAFRVLQHLQPNSPIVANESRLLLQRYGGNLGDLSLDPSSPAGLGNLAAASIINSRAFDGSNEAGNYSGTPSALKGTKYADYTNYYPANPPQTDVLRTNCSALRSINKWQPLLANVSGQLTVQQWASPQMSLMEPFSELWSLGDLRTRLKLTGPALNGTNTHSAFIEQNARIVDYSANLNDRNKAIVDYWRDSGKGSVSPCGHWQQFAIAVAADRNLSVLNTTEALFLQSAASLDGAIASWNLKRLYDSVRPITAVQCIYAGQNITAWRGPYQGVGSVSGSEWLPYQSEDMITPPFGEYPSGHSAFSAGAAQVLTDFLGDSTFDAFAVVPAGGTLVEPKIDDPSDPRFIANVTDVPNTGIDTVGYAPAEDVTLSWPTFESAAEEAGISREYGGLHYQNGDSHSLRLGKEVGHAVYLKFQRLLEALKTNQTVAHEHFARATYDSLSSDSNQ